MSKTENAQHLPVEKKFSLGIQWRRRLRRARWFRQGGADVSLTADGDATILQYSATADVGGRLAQFGGRLRDSAANKLAGDFFEKFSAIVSKPQSVEVTASWAHEAGCLSKTFGSIGALLKGCFSKLVDSSVASLLCLCLSGNACCLRGMSSRRTQCSSQRFARHFLQPITISPRRKMLEKWYSSARNLLTKT